MRDRSRSTLGTRAGDAPSPRLAAAHLGAEPGEPLTAADVDPLPELARRYLRASLSEGSPVVPAVRLRMRGYIKLGWWIPFIAQEWLNPRSGFLWQARVAAPLFSGTDHYLDGRGAMHWRLLGIVPVLGAAGPDVALSAAGRAAAESLWVPAAVLPRYGATWEETGPSSATVRFAIDRLPAVIHYEFDDRGRIRSGYIERWGDPDRTGTSGWHRCGGEVTRYQTFGSVTIPSAGRLGWHYGTDGWKRSEFFRYEITAVEPLRRGAPDACAATGR